MTIFLFNIKVFDFIKNINDPEHPLTLEQLDIVSYQNIQVDNETNSILVFFKPTIPHCSVANLIGLMIRAKLLRSLSAKFKVKLKLYTRFSIKKCDFIGRNKNFTGNTYIRKFNK